MKEASQIPNILNMHFASVGNRLASKLSSPPKHHLDYFNKCINPLSTFLFEQVFPDKIRSEILSISNDKSYDLYSSPTKLLKLSSSIKASILSELLNISIKSGTLTLSHQSLKLPQLHRYFKVMMKVMPIIITDLYSLLSNFNRIFEKIMYKKNDKLYIEKHLLYPSQYGFRNGNSTQHAILDIINDIQTNMNHFLVEYL